MDPSASTTPLQRKAHLLVVLVAHVEGPELGAELGVCGDVVEPVGRRFSQQMPPEGRQHQAHTQQVEAKNSSFKEDWKPLGAPPAHTTITNNYPQSPTAQTPTEPLWGLLGGGGLRTFCDENRFFKSRDGHFWVDLPSLVTWI